eukprot:TRINITY_DN12704_c0_g1_i2.p1 TRINITY_DN12704_c0_g1~~TRINITY_DN12704_c0_g1_i2.p1  ORF type:complete len:396 (-),score=66.53 TRINITY_DN12704_c0_g1_i2:19-1206(-)
MRAALIAVGSYLRSTSCQTLQVASHGYVLKRTLTTIAPRPISSIYVQSRPTIGNAIPIVSFVQTRSFQTSKSNNAPKDPYDVLGISKTASKDEIKKAYYQLAKKYHPDVNKDNKSANEKFQEINSAYEILGDEKKKQQYDQHGFVDENPFGGGAGGGGYRDASSIFEEFMRQYAQGGGGGGGGFDIFGNQQREQIIGVRLSFMEAINGCRKSVSYQVAEKCGTCNGTKAAPGTKVHKCKTCNGSGYERKSSGMMVIQIPCRTCSGSGSHIPDPCKTCKGTGTVSRNKTAELEIPAGVDDGDTLRGRDMSQPPIQVRVSPHEYFLREGNDIHLHVPLTLAQATLGGFITIPTITNDVELKVEHPPYESSSQLHLYTIKQKLFKCRRICNRWLKEKG